MYKHKVRASPLYIGKLLCCSGKCHFISVGAVKMEKWQHRCHNNFFFLLLPSFYFKFDYLAFSLGRVAVYKYMHIYNAAPHSTIEFTHPGVYVLHFIELIMAIVNQCQKVFFFGEEKSTQYWVDFIIFSFSFPFCEMRILLVMICQGNFKGI